MEDEEKELTFEEKLKTFVWWTENELSITKSFLPDHTTVKIDIDLAEAAAQFIREKINM